VEGCRGTVDELSKELDKLSLGNASHVAPGKRRRIKGSVQWCLKENKTRKLLDEAMQHKSTLTLALLGEITSDVKGIKSTVKQVHDNLTNADRRKMCDWIEHTNPTPIHNRSLKNHEEHTCQWIHRVDQWTDWLQLQRRFIWVHGIPGAGKTVLASYLIQQTLQHCESRNSDRIDCLYYYCSFLHGQEERRDEALPFLFWVVSQLCRRCDHIPLHLIPLYRKNNVPSFQDLEVALQKLLANFDVLYIVVDAVDESNPRDNLLKVLQDIVTQPNYAKIQLLATSRRYSDIEEVLRPLSEPTLPMSNSIVDVDIRTYVNTIIKQNKYFVRWPGTLRNEIVESLVRGAQGMWV
jgi:Cdc6-like AAA superfamily ATPase